MARLRLRSTPAPSPRAVLVLSLARHAQQLARWADDGVEGARHARTVVQALATIAHHGAWDVLPGLAQAATSTSAGLDPVEVRETRASSGLLDSVLPPGPKRTVVFVAVAASLFILTLVARFVART